MVTADTLRSITIHPFGSENLSGQSQATDLKRNGAGGEVSGAAMFILSINFDFGDECYHHKPQYHGFLEAVAVLLRNSK